MNKPSSIATGLTEHAIDVYEAGRKPRRGRIGMHLGSEIHFSTSAIESFLIAPWKPIIDDALVVAASIEFADRSVKRPAHGWARRFSLRIPVFELERWSDEGIRVALVDAIGFLTGDSWIFEFIQRRTRPETRPEPYLELPGQAEAVLAYSDGMDSRAVSGLLGAELGDRLVPVRLGKKSDRNNRDNKVPFTGIPYKIKSGRRSRESSARSRGFKFSLISGIAAFLSKASTIIVPESGQGILGPVLTPVSHAYPDYRNHPMFTTRMQRFMNRLFEISVEFEFPRMWSTKGETLAAFVNQNSNANWQSTRSCWMKRWCVVNKRRRQCGICAACLLRRMSVHTAQLTETPDTYIWNKLTANTFEKAMNPEFLTCHRTFREYAIAGTLHLDHLADLAYSDCATAIKGHAHLLASEIEIPSHDVESKILSLFSRHAKEWDVFLSRLGSDSFLNQLARGKR